MEMILIPAAVALLVSLGVDFLASWGMRLRMRRCEAQLFDLEGDLLTEKKRRAAYASVDSRRRSATELDAAIVKQHTGVDLAQPEAEEPWWAKVVGQKVK